MPRGRLLWNLGVRLTYSLSRGAYTGRFKITLSRLIIDISNGAHAHTAHLVPNLGGFLGFFSLLTTRTAPSPSICGLTSYNITMDPDVRLIQLRLVQTVLVYSSEGA